MRRVLGAQLAAFRQAAELTQDELASAAFCDRSTVAHIEKGRSRGDRRFWKVADERCGADGALLAAFHAWETAKQDHEVRTREAQLAEARAKAEQLRATTAPQLLRDADETAREVAVDGGDQLAEQLVKLLCRWVGVMDPVRRELLQLLGWAMTTATVSSVVAGLDTEERERLARAIVSPSQVDGQVINHLDAILLHCKRQDDTLGPRAVLDTVLAQRNLVRDLLAGCPATLRPRLLSLYSNMSSSVGFYFFDLNEFDRAWRYGDQARMAAHDANNAELGIHALGHMSYFASWQGKTHTGMDLVAAARSLLSKTEDPLLGVCVAQRAATVYAIDGQYTACMAEFERAQNGLATSTGQVSAESPAYFYNEGFLASKKSECLLWLGKSQEAAVNATAGLTLFDKSYVGSLAFCTLRLGNAHLQSGEIVEAARLVGDAAGLAAQTRQVRLARELRTTRARMQPWQGSQAVAALDDQLAEYGLASGFVT